MKIVPISEVKLEEIITLFKAGGLVISPSDTVYGLLADSSNETAIDKLIQFKSRPPGKPISVFVDSQAMLERTVFVNTRQQKTLKSLLPGPFTIILPSKKSVSRKLEAESGTLGVRLTGNSLINKLVNTLGRPITATSANLSGRSAHYNSQTLLAQFPKKKLDLIDLLIDGGELPRNKPSTILDLTAATVKVLRKGDIVTSSEQKFITDSPLQSMKSAQYIFRKYEGVLKEKPLVFILQGDLGVGKTVFVKGLAELFNINNIISPTFVVYYEYDLPGVHDGTLIHADLYNVIDDEEYKHLGLSRYLKPGNILCIEWGEKAKPIFEEMKSKAMIIFIKMRYLSQNKRELSISEVKK